MITRTLTRDPYQLWCCWVNIGLTGTVIALVYRGMMRHWKVLPWPRKRPLD